MSVSVRQRWLGLDSRPRTLADIWLERSPLDRPCSLTDIWLERSLARTGASDRPCTLTDIWLAPDPRWRGTGSPGLEA